MYGCRPWAFMSLRTGAMTNSERNSDSPTITWLGGMALTPRAFRVSDSTMTMRVKLVIIISSAGATESSVSTMMITTDWLGFSTVSPGSMLIDRPLVSAVGEAGTAGAGAWVG